MEILENRAEWDSAFRAGWLAHFEETGETNWKLYNRPDNSPLPATSGIDLTQNRLVLISSAGGYLADTQESFDAADLLGDYTVRTWSIDTSFSDIALAHDHYNHEAVNADSQVLLPIGHLQEMVQAGQIGELALSVISYMGYQPDLRRVVDELIPAILPIVQELQADAALLVPS